VPYACWTGIQPESSAGAAGRRLGSKYELSPQHEALGGTFDQQEEIAAPPAGVRKDIRENIYRTISIKILSYTLIWLRI
jgi:hypothetical protein